MIVRLKMLASLRAEVCSDLARPHPFAFERVGFLKARVGRLINGVVILPFQLLTVPDDAYVKDGAVGACVSDAGFRAARQSALAEGVSIVHVHIHDHAGRPGFSGTDASETQRFMPDFLKVRPDRPHVALILSQDSAAGRCWMGAASGPVPIASISVIGASVQKVLDA